MAAGRELTSRRTYTRDMLARRFATVVLALTWVPMVCPPAASAQGLVERRPRGEHRIETKGVSLDRAVELAQSRYRAKAIKAETVGEIHQIRLLNAQGRVWTVRVDARTGRMY